MARVTPSAREALLYDLVEATYFVVEQTEANITGVIDDLGLTRPLADVIWALPADEPPKTMGELASALGVEPSSATFLVDRLHEKGYVERGSDPRDRRRTTVTLTQAGTEARGLLVRTVRDRSPVADLPLDDIRTLVSLLRKALGDTKPKYTR
jgi:DNA-binding MarR family transcriptional regulator